MDKEAFFPPAKREQPRNGLNISTALLQQMANTFLKAKEAASLSTTSKKTRLQLQASMKQRQLRHYFLCYVVRGEYGLMKQMLVADIELLFKREGVRDFSGRVFESISGFEYVLWALDKHQWDDMLACLPKDSNGHLTEKSLKVVAELKKQYAALKVYGVIYTLNGVIKREPHYDFALIDELQKQISAHDANGPKDLNGMAKQWCVGVGGAQRLCPMHVVDEYCATTPVAPRPSFNSRPQQPNGLRKFYNSISSKNESWFGANSQLGIDFAIYNGSHGLLGARSVPENMSAYVYATMALCQWLLQTRTENFRALGELLNSLLPNKVASSVAVVDAQNRFSV